MNGERGKKLAHDQPPQTVIRRKLLHQSVDASPPPPPPLSSSPCQAAVALHVSDVHRVHPFSFNGEKHRRDRSLFQHPGPMVMNRDTSGRM